MKEIWRKYKDNPTYQVSNLGRLRNTNTKQIVQTYVNMRTGYLWAHVWDKTKGKYRSESFNKLMRMTWFKKKGHLHHLDGNRLNNKLTNLMIVTQSEHIHETYKNGKKMNYVTKDHPTRWTEDGDRVFCYKTSFEERQEMRRLYKSGVSQIKIADKFGIHNSTCSKIVRRDF